MTLSEIKHKVGADTISRKGDVITVKRGFFYRMGNSEDTFAENVKRAYPNAEIIEAKEVWRQWPGHSYWYVKFRLR